MIVTEQVFDEAIFVAVSVTVQTALQIPVSPESDPVIWKVVELAPGVTATTVNDPV